MLKVVQHDHCSACSGKKDTDLVRNHYLEILIDVKPSWARAAARLFHTNFLLQEDILNQLQLFMSLNYHWNYWKKSKMVEQ